MVGKMLFSSASKAALPSELLMALGAGLTAVSTLQVAKWQLPLLKVAQVCTTEV